MSKKRLEIIKRMKRDLHYLLSEAFGGHSLDEEDQATWKFKAEQVDEIIDIEDVVDRAEGLHIDVDDFFVRGEYEVLTAGMDIEDVPMELIIEAGELIAEQSGSIRECVKVYYFDKTYFTIKPTVTTSRRKVDALKAAGIKL